MTLSRRRLLELLVGTTGVLLFWSDLFNYLAAGTVVVAWKQLLVAIFWAIAFTIKTEKWCRDLLVCSLFAQLMLCIASLVQGVEVESAIFNSMLYTSWVPFFLVLSRAEVVDFLKRSSGLWLGLVVLSAMGLALDLYTDAFSFLPRNDLDNSFYDRHGLAKRATFFFPAKTMVVPIIGAAGVIVLAGRASAMRAVMLGAGVLVAILATGSLSSLGAGAILIGAFILSVPGRRARVMAIAALSTLLICVAAISATDLRVSRQLEKVVANRDAGSVANVGRVDLWLEAKDEIARQDPLSVAVGYGLGVTNDAHGNRAIYTHGESSILQAQLEGGLIAVFFRLLPFVLLGFFVYRNRSPLRVSMFAWTMGSFLAIALAPTFGNMPFMFFLSLMLAITWRVRASDTVTD